MKAWSCAGALTSHDGSADKDNFEEKGHRRAAVLWTQADPSHKAVYTSYTAHYWYKHFINLFSWLTAVVVAFKKYLSSSGFPGNKSFNDG